MTEKVVFQRSAILMAVREVIYLTQRRGWILGDVNSLKIKGG
jgi:hypothetical protein